MPPSASPVSAAPPRKNSVAIIVKLIALYFFFVALTAIVDYILPFEYYIISFIIVLVIGIILNFLPSRTSVGTPSGTSRNWGGWATTILGIVIILILIVAIAPGLLEISDKTYSPEELVKYATPGSASVVDGEFVCNGCTIFIPNDENIGWLKVVPGSAQLPKTIVSFDKTINEKGVEVYVYQVAYYISDGKYIAEIYYEGVTEYTPYSVSSTTERYTLSIWTPFLRLVGADPVSSWTDSVHAEDPRVSIDSHLIASSEMRKRPNERSQKLLGGDITIKFEGNAKIESVKVAYSSYEWKELLYKKTGISL